MDTDDFAAMLAAAQVGSPWAFRQLYGDLSPGVAGYFRARGVADVEDLTSDVFLSVFTRLQTFSGDERALRSWVFTIAHHRYVDHVRRHVRSVPVVPFEPLTDPRSAMSAEDAAAADMGSADIERMLAGLPDDQRTVIALRVVADMSLEDTAAALGKSQGAVKQLQRRALLSLRKAITATGGVPQ